MPRACTRNVGSQVITAIHCSAYMPIAVATAHGAGCRSGATRSANLRLVRAGGRNVPRSATSAAKHATAATMAMIHSARQPAASITGAESSTVTATPNGMYVLHTPSARRRSRTAAAPTISAGADTAMQMKPAPSDKARHEQHRAAVGERADGAADGEEREAEQARAQRADAIREEAEEQRADDGDDVEHRHHPARRDQRQAELGLERGQRGRQLADERRRDDAGAHRDREGEPVGAFGQAVVRLRDATVAG